MSETYPKIFCFFPLASIGGTEMVHADVLRALQAYNPRVYIRYRGNVWKGKAYAASAEGRNEGAAMVPVYTQFSRLTFCSDYLEAPRLGRIIRKLFIQRLARTINHSKNPVVIFWHRESIEFLWPYLKSHVTIIDIIHNNSNNEYPDGRYLVNDWAERINKRVLVSEGLKKWITPLYKEAGYEKKLIERCHIITHAVDIPKTIQKDTTPPLHIAFVGRDSVEKRFELILQVANLCQVKNLPVQFHIAGPDPDKFLESSSPNMMWYGEVRERNKLNEIYQKCHVLLLTSSSEGFPKVVAEAMAFECIPVVTKVGGMADHIQHNETGILTDADNCVNESIHWITELIKDTELRERLGKSAYSYACKKFSFTTFEAGWKKIIDAGS